MVSRIFGDIHVNERYRTSLDMIEEWSIPDLTILRPDRSILTLNLSRPRKDCAAWQVSLDPAQLVSSITWRGVTSTDTEWQWQQGDYDPGHYTHPSKPHVRFAHPTETEDKRLKITFLPLGGQILRLEALCVCLETADVSSLRQPLQSPPSMHNCPIVDDEDFMGGMLDMDVLPSSSSFLSRGDICESSLALRPVKCSLENHPHTISIIALSRFTGSALTEESPHYNARPSTDPRLDDTTLLQNICLPIAGDVISSSGSTWDDVSFEGEDNHLWTYDPRRYQPNKYYPFFKILLVEWTDGIAYRLGIGQMHVDAFLHAQPHRRVFSLG